MFVNSYTIAIQIEMKNEVIFFRIRLVLTVVGTISFFTYTYYSDKNSDKRNCERYHEFLKEKIHGIIVRAYIDEDNHCYPMLIVKSDNGIEETRNIIEMENPQFLIYNVDPGDSISKEIGSNIIVIKKRYSTSEPHLFPVSYLCKE